MNNKKIESDIKKVDQVKIANDSNLQNNVNIVKNPDINVIQSQDNIQYVDDKLNNKKKINKKIKRVPIKRVRREYYYLNDNSNKATKIDLFDGKTETYDLLPDIYENKNTIDFDNIKDIKLRVDEIRSIRDLKPDEFISKTDIAKLVTILGSVGAALYINKYQTNWFSRAADYLSYNHTDNIGNFFSENKGKIASGLLFGTAAYLTGGLSGIGSAVTSSITTAAAKQAADALNK